MTANCYSNEFTDHDVVLKLLIFIKNVFKLFIFIKNHVARGGGYTCITAVFPARIHDIFHEASGNIFCFVSYDSG